MQEKGNDKMVLSIMGFVIFALFACNLAAAIDSKSTYSANVFTAISGWVSFLATAGVGIIAYSQAKKYSDSADRTNTKIRELTEQIERMLWVVNMSTVELDVNEDMIETKQQRKSQFLSLRASETGNVEFFLFGGKEIFNPHHSYLQNEIEISLLNTSEVGIDRIGIDSFSRIINGKQEYYNDVIASFPKVQVSKSKNIRISFHFITDVKLDDRYFEVPPQIIFTISIKNEKGIICRRKMHVCMTIKELLNGKRVGKPYTFNQTEYVRN